LLAACSGGSPTLTTKEQLGSDLFSDPNLSSPAGNSCADCHTARKGFADPETSFSTSSGAIKNRFGARNAPTALYAKFIPPLHFDAAANEYKGGLFADGRADSLEAQAAGPLLNPLEMNNADAGAVAAKVRASSYADQFRHVFGASSLDDDKEALTHVTEAIAAFERTQTLAPFSSKYDLYLQGKELLTPEEQRGLAIFEDPKRGNCASCHPSRPSADGTPPLFTNFGYANLGIPKYMNSVYLREPAPFNPDGDAFVDHGLMSTVHDPAQDGKFRTPTLRNIARTNPYGHNGYFADLRYMLKWLNSRDNGGWKPPEVAANVDSHVGHLGLSDADIDDLQAFLKTLNDGYSPTP
jgi:cytochrome c peroxidase